MTGRENCNGKITINPDGTISHNCWHHVEGEGKQTTRKAKKAPLKKWRGRILPKREYTDAFPKFYEWKDEGEGGRLLKTQKTSSADFFAGVKQGAKKGR